MDFKNNDTVVVIKSPGTKSIVARTYSGYHARIHYTKEGTYYVTILATGNQCTIPANCVRRLESN